MDCSQHDSDSEEEILIYATLNDMDHSMMKLDAVPFLKVIDIDSETPIVQINDTVLQGKHEKCMGTHMFFEEDEDPPTGDPVFEPKPEKCLKYFNKTRKVLSMNRVFVTDVDKLKEESAEQPVSAPHHKTFEEAAAQYKTLLDNYTNTNEGIKVERVPLPKPKFMPASFQRRSQTSNNEYPDSN